MRLVIALSVLTAAWTGGCVEGDPGLSVTGMDVLDDCTAAPGVSNVGLHQWDLNAGRGYLAGPKLASQLRENSTDIGADKAILRVEGVEVELFEADAMTPLDLPVNPYTSRGATTIESSSGAGNSTNGAIVVTLIPSDYIAELEPLLGTSPSRFDVAQIIASIRPFGRTNGNVSVTGKDFMFPIQLCAGCLQTCADDFTEHECIGGQDGVPYCITP